MRPHLHGLRRAGRSRRQDRRRDPARSRIGRNRGAAIAHPVRLREVLGTLLETRGGAVTLTEAEIGAATLDLARIGIYVEPTSAQAAAAFGKLLQTGTITPDQTTVLVMTGTGVTATPRIAEMLRAAL